MFPSTALRECHKLLGIVSTAMLLAGCGGRLNREATRTNTDAGSAGYADASLQFDGSAAVKINSQSLGGVVGLCPTTYAHPNVCCHGGIDIATTCVERPGAVFAPCAAAWLTFPDRSLCCSLEDPKSCVVISDADAATGSSPGPICYYPCGPGGYPASEDPNSPSLPACTDVLEAGAPCDFCCGPHPGRCAWNISFGCDGELSCPPSKPACSACPNGWHMPAGVPDLCCRDTGPGECFSQANEVRLDAPP
jgi:hypothetical protein